MVCARAELSRQSFYEHFSSLEECFVAVLDDAYEEAKRVILCSFETADTWQDGVREALASLLVIFESRPDIARIWMLESLSAGSRVLRHREQKVVKLTEVIAEHWQAPAGLGTLAIAPSAVMAAILGTIQRHLATDAPEPLITLLGPLMGIAATPFLPADEIAVQIRLADQLAIDIGLGARRPADLRPQEAIEIPLSVLDVRAHRARACLVYLAEHPGASNRQIADGIGVTSHTQISSVLSRIARLDLATKTKGGSGHPNAWRLTAQGAAVATALSRFAEPAMS